MTDYLLPVLFGIGYIAAIALLALMVYTAIVVCFGRFLRRISREYPEPDALYEQPQHFEARATPIRLRDHG